VRCREVSLLRVLYCVELCAALAGGLRLTLVYHGFCLSFVRLRRTGEFTAVSGIEPGSDVAIRPNHLTSEWILGRVIYHDADTGAYDVVDVDDSKVLRLPETQVVALDGANLESVRRLAKNDEVLVVYPDTSTFYPAILTQAPRRGSFMGVEPTALVQFAGDEPDITTGIIAPKSVPLNHVIRPPMW
jgi:hypothetical protein